MARRNDHSRDEIRSMSLDAAEAILAREGAGALSVRRIAQSIGYTHGTLYLVFDNLDGLLLEVNRRTLDELTTELDEACADSPPGRPRLRALALAYLDFARANPERFRLIFEFRMAEDLPNPDWLVMRVGRGYSLLASALEESGIENAGLLAATLWCTIHGATVLALDGKLVDASGARLDAAKVLSQAVAAFTPA
jgi:AcrR family transcriptional regulator